jgi:putative ABC transport system ATP-binding protein
VIALRGVDAEFARGSVTIVAGPSGAGKSTLLRLLACLERPVAGEIRFHGVPTAHLRGRARRSLTASQIGYVFQRPRENLFEYLRVDGHMCVAKRMRGVGRSNGDDGLLRLAGLDSVAGERPSALGAGGQQKLALLMAVVGSPALVIADEPTADLDAEDTASVCGLIGLLAAAGQTFVIASHDPALVSVADSVLVIAKGTVAARGRPEEILSVIDSAGRIALGEHAAQFAGGQARIVRVDDHLRIEQP